MEDISSFVCKGKAPAGMKDKLQRQFAELAKVSADTPGLGYKPKSVSCNDTN